MSVAACGQNVKTSSTGQNSPSNVPTGIGATPESGMPGPVYSAEITFAPSVSYAQALRIITGLGLQTFRPIWPTWQFEGDQSALPNLLVSSTPVAAPLWLSRLKAMPEIKNVESNPVFGCTAMPATSPSNANTFLPENKAGTYLRVTFSGPLNSYNAALDAINNQGFRLADPCYEQARASGAKPTWSTMGQENFFAGTHILLLATTRFNAVQWGNQLHALTGVIKVEAPFKAIC